MENNELTAKELIPKAIQILNENLEQENCSVIWIRAKLAINYNKACDLVDLLEKSGHLSSIDFQGRRKILKRI